VLSVNDMNKNRMFLRKCDSFILRKSRYTISISLVETPLETFFSRFGVVSVYDVLQVSCARVHPLGADLYYKCIIPSSVITFFPLPFPDANCIRPWSIGVHTTTARSTCIIYIVIILVGYYYCYLEHAHHMDYYLPSPMYSTICT